MWVHAFRKQKYTNDMNTTNAVESWNQFCIYMRICCQVTYSQVVLLCSVYKYKTVKWAPDKSLTRQIQDILYCTIPMQENNYHICQFKESRAYRTRISNRYRCKLY